MTASASLRRPRALLLDFGGVIVETGTARQLLETPAQPRTQEFLRRVLRPTESST